MYALVLDHWSESQLSSPFISSFPSRLLHGEQAAAWWRYRQDKPQPFYLLLLPKLNR
jgi:hypothetical protein